MGLKFGKKIFKKITVIASIIVFLVLFIAVVVFAVEHPKALSEDDEDGTCADSVVNAGYNQFCSDFAGDGKIHFSFNYGCIDLLSIGCADHCLGFGPGAGWYLILVSLILSVSQFVLVWTYACSCTCIKRVGYTSVR